MQPPAGHPHPHTRTRPAHWLGTAVALTVVVGLSAVIQPTDATANNAPRAAGAAAEPGAPTSRQGPDPERADYPLDCGPWEVGVVHHASADFDGDNAPETVAVVRCATEGGTPPSGVYVLSSTDDDRAAPRIARTLVDPGERLSVDDFAVRDGVISATLRGYSSDEVPRCCPDQARAVTWRWADDDFTLRAAPLARHA